MVCYLLFLTFFSRSILRRQATLLNSHVWNVQDQVCVLTFPILFTEFNLQREGEKAYSTFAAAAEHKALKMIITTE